MTYSIDSLLPDDIPQALKLALDARLPHFVKDEIIQIDLDYIDIRFAIAREYGLHWDSPEEAFAVVDQDDRAKAARILRDERMMTAITLWRTRSALTN